MFLNLSGEMLERSKQKEIQMSDEEKDGGKEETSATPAEPQVDDLGNPVEPEEGGDKTATPAAEEKKEVPPAPEKKFTDADMAAERKKYQSETRLERDARIRAEAKAEILESLAVKKPETPQAQVTDAMPQRPNRDAFDTQEEFDEAWDQYIDKKQDFKIAQAEKKRNAEDEARRKQTDGKTETQKAQERLEAHIKAGTEKYPDFEDVVVKSETPFTPTMINMLLKRDNGQDIAYHLGKNSDDFKRIAAITDRDDLAAEIGVLSHQLKTAPPKVPEGKLTTKAPSPPTTLQGSKSIATAKLAKDATSSEERFRIFEAEEREKRGRKA